jgi:predicted NUDIX family NTP pyrophosphohydrolase
MPKQSAGLMMYRKREGHIETFLVYPGGPYWAQKDLGVWTIPKGEFEGSEAPLDGAKREFHEETGFDPQGQFIELGTVKQNGGKIVAAWAFEGDCDADALTSNLCEIEWPPRSGHRLQFPEVDRGRWFSIAEAREHILKSQEALLDRLCAALGLSPGVPNS